MRPDAPLDDDRALGPAEMLALVEDQQRSVAGKRGGFVPLILFAWGTAWLVGFAALWLTEGLRPGFALPIEVAATIFIVLLIAAIILSAVLGARVGRGTRGGKDAVFTGVAYGQVWWLGPIAIYIIGGGLVANGMSAELLAVYYPTMYVFFAGLMYVFAGILWRAVPMLYLGAWSVVVGTVAPFFRVPTHYLVYAIAGGGGFLIAAIISLVWIRRGRRSAPGRVL
ncbi:hypothetical protein [Granulicoccus sp. GXG6511]|uniref:hypothetical protein n=1 Tax=Granulicoccus sp. GXG6511 TaxID=3381351 RepID=UPI003D7D8FC7